MASRFQTRTCADGAWLRRLGQGKACSAPLAFFLSVAERPAAVSTFTVPALPLPRGSAMACGEHGTHGFQTLRCRQLAATAGGSPALNLGGYR